MHLIQSYSLAVGQPIGSPNLPIDFYPLEVERYIVFQPFSKPAKSYDYFSEVLQLLIPIFNSLKISVVQIGAANEQSFPGCINLQGKTTLAQGNYLIKNAIMNLSVDSWSAHVAGIFNIPLVALYSNNKVNNVCPFFGDKSKQILLDCYEKDELPTYVLQEHPKRINKIKPETIYKSVLKLLGINIEHSLESLYFGSHYNNLVIESIPDQIYDPKQLGGEGLTLRFDKFYNPAMLQHQAAVCPINIYTNKEIDINLLKSIQPRLQNIFYVIEKDNNPEFIKQLFNNGFRYTLLSSLSEQEINDNKLKYSDYGIIHHRKPLNPNELPEFKSVSVEKLLFKTNKYVIYNKDLYPSHAHLAAKIKINGLNDRIFNVIDNPDFWIDWEHCYFLKNNQ